jgi:putative acetyltransferase
VRARDRGRGVGRMLMEAAVAEARAKGARRLFLETNSKLGPAIRLYERMGFVHMAEKPPSEYDRSNVSMELML